MVALLMTLVSADAWAQPDDQSDDQSDPPVDDGDDTDDTGDDDSTEIPDPPDDATDVVPEAPPPPDIEDLRRRLREAEERIDEVETAKDRQRIFWAGSYRTSVAGYRYRGPSPDGARDPMTGIPIEVEDTNGEQWLHRLRMDIRANPLPNLRFTGRLVMFKRFGQNSATPFPQDQADTAIPRDTGVRIERAWLDWFITPSIALSAGRISYSDGPPAELKENLERADATWGLHMVDGEFDTVDLTFELSDRFLGRLFYASWAFARNDDLFSENLFLNSGVDNLRIFGGNFDIRVPELGDFFMQLGAYTVPEFRPFFIPIPNPLPPPNPSDAPPPFDGSLIYPAVMPDSLGTYSNLSALMLWKDLGGTGLDIFGAVALGIIDPNGQAISYNLPVGPMGELMVVPALGLASADVGGENSLFLFAGARFTPKLGKNSPRFGFEFNRGSKYWFSFTSPKLNLLNKLANRGTVLEAYYIQPINGSLFFRIGATHLQQDYAGSFFGPLDPSVGGTAPPTDRRVQAYEALLHATF